MDQSGSGQIIVIASSKRRTASLKSAWTALWYPIWEIQELRVWCLDRVHNSYAQGTSQLTPFPNTCTKSLQILLMRSILNRGWTPWILINTENQLYSFISQSPFSDKSTPGNKKKNFLIRVHYVALTFLEFTI